VISGVSLSRKKLFELSALSGLDIEADEPLRVFLQAYQNVALDLRECELQAPYSDLASVSPFWTPRRAS